MRILILTTAYAPLVGGSEIAIAQIARHMPDVYFDILTPRYSKDVLSLEQSGNTIIHRLGLGSTSDKWLFPILGAFKALILSFKNKYKALHAYQASYGAMAAWLVRTIKPSLPFILTLQEGKELHAQSKLLQSVRRSIIKKADRITAISSYLKEFAVAQGAKTMIEVIPNGVDIELFKPGEIPPGPERTIISASRLVEKNGLENLLKAFQKIQNQQPIKLILAGDGPLKNRLESLASELKLKNTSFLGTVPYEELPGLLASADIFVRPSLSEGLGSAFLEAMACGLPVIGSPVGGIPDFLKHEETGLFCDPKNPDDIAEKILHLLNNPILRERIRSNGLKFINDNYQWPKIAQRMASVYLSV